MRLTDFAKGSAWAIVPERFDELARRFATTEITEEMILRAKKEGAALFKIGVDAENESPLYSLTDDGAAIIPINGPLVKDPFLAWWFGGTTFQGIRAAVGAAADDDRVAGIVLDFDSPGGTVSGTEETAEEVFAVRGSKPIVSFSSGMMASAAYWIGSAAERVIVSKTAEAGSIGVLMIHREFSELEKRIGIKTTYLKAGRYKAVGNPSEPLSDDARAIFQGQLDQIYSMFVGAVALYRDTEEEKVLSDMAEGRIFIGERAVVAGLADQVGNLQTAVDAVLSAAEERSNKDNRRIFVMQKQGIEVKSYDDLKAVGGDILKEAENKAFTLGAESVDLVPAQKEGADQERERVLGLAAAFMGEEQGGKFADLVKSGVTVDQFKAIQAIQKPVEKMTDDPKKAEMLDAIKAAGAENPGAGGGDRGPVDFFALVDQVQKEKGCSKFDAMKEVTRRHPEARKQMLENANPKLRVAK